MKMQNINLSYEYLIHVNCRNDSYAMNYCVQKNRYAELRGSYALKDPFCIHISVLRDSYFQELKLKDLS